jgi:hypothetical protein
MKDYFRNIVRGALRRLVGNQRLEEWKRGADTFNPLTLRNTQRCRRRLLPRTFTAGVF